MIRLWAFFLLVSWVSPGAIVEGSYTENQTTFTWKGTWNPIAGMNESGSSTTLGVDWIWGISSSARGAAAHDLLFQWKHQKAPHGEAPNPPEIDVYHQLGVDNLTRPAAGSVGRAQSHQKKHGDHIDTVSLSAVLPAAGAGGITATGKHSISPDAAWSYTAASPGAIRVKAGGKRASGDITVAPPQHYGGKLPKGTTEYTVIFAGSGVRLPVDPITYTTLAFLGDVDGLNGMLDLGAAIDLFGVFFAPMLLDSAGQRDLHVGIDLTQWVNFPQPFAPGQLFTFVNGVSDELPGFVAGFSPVSFVPGLGYTTADPANGSFEAVGAIDGETVPEPRTAALVAVCCAGLVLWRRRNRAVTTSATARTEMSKCR